jgi:hypothetical protein
LVLVKSHENSLEIIDQGMGLPSFYNHIINIGFDKVILYLILETVLDACWYVAPTFLSPNNIIV